MLQPRLLFQPKPTFVLVQVHHQLLPLQTLFIPVNFFNQKTDFLVSPNHSRIVGDGVNLKIENAVSI